MPGEVAIRLEVGGVGRSGQRIRRPEAPQGAIAVEQVVRYGVVGHPIEVQNRIRFSLVGGRRLRALICGPDQELLLLKGDEGEELVPNDWAAKRESVVLIAGCRFRGCEGIRLLESLIVVKIVDGSVDLVGTRLDGQVSGAARIAAQRRRAGGLKGEILYGIDGEDDAGDSRDAALVHGGNVPPQIVVVRALNLPIDGVGARAVDAGVTRAAAGG